MSLKTQAKVLRALQEQVVEPVGGAASVRVDVRVLAATNKDLPAEIRLGRFREDLYFRLNVIPIFVPPLRDRPDDIPLLAQHFMTELSREYGRRPKQFDAGAAAGLRSCRWPGNVRELRNVVERLMIMVPGDTIHLSDLSFLDAAAIVDLEEPGPVAPLHEARDRFEREYILKALAAQHGQHLADGRGARRRAQQPVPEDARVRHRAGAPRRGRGRAGTSPSWRSVRVNPRVRMAERRSPRQYRRFRRIPRLCRTPKWDQLRAQILHCSSAIVGWVIQDRIKGAV